MTSFAFIMGVVPLVLSTGAGAEMRHAMGIAVFFGMLGVTFFGLFLTPGVLRADARAGKENHRKGAGAKAMRKIQDVPVGRVRGTADRGVRDHPSGPAELGRSGARRRGASLPRPMRRSP